MWSREFPLPAIWDIWAAGQQLDFVTRNTSCVRFPRRKLIGVVVFNRTSHLARLSASISMIMLSFLKKNWKMLFSREKFKNLMFTVKTKQACSIAAVSEGLRAILNPTMQCKFIKEKKMAKKSLFIWLYCKSSISRPSKWRPKVSEQYLEYAVFNFKRNHFWATI